MLRIGVSASVPPTTFRRIFQALPLAALILFAGCKATSLKLFPIAKSERLPPVTAPTEAPTTTEAQPTAPQKAEIALATNTTTKVTPTALVQQPPEEIPALEPAEKCRLDMSTALALVAGQNPQVGFARWRIREAYANLEQANVLWLPSIQAGLSYNHHEGTLQDSEGQILEISRSSFQSGMGAGAVGAGTTPFPGIIAQFQLVDAIFQPAIAQRSAWAQEHARDAVLNDQLLEAAVAYQELLRAHQLRAVAIQTVGGSEQLVKLTTDYARAGQGTLADEERSLTELALRKNDVARADENVAVASARLAQVLSMSGGQEIVPVEDSIAPITLTTTGTSQENLATALGNRPELHESRDLVAAAIERLRRERYAPLVPSILLGASYGGFGGGTGSTIGDFDNRADFDAMALWQIRNLGYGEQSARQAANARVQQETMRQVRVMDTVAREVTEAEARVRTRFIRIGTAKSGVESARLSFDRNFLRIREAQGLPIEVLQAIQARDASQRELVDATADYNIAQFQLQRALGWPMQ